jgi:trigger factor
MQIEVKEIEPCKLSVHYEADAEQILNKRSEVFQAFKKAPVPGFRPGKVSPDAIKIHYKSQIEDSLKRGLAEDAFHNTIFEKKLRAHGAPRFNSLSLMNGKFSCDFELYTKPDFELSKYLDLAIPKPHSDLSQNDLTEKMLQDLRVRLGDHVPYSESDFVVKSDNIILNYEGSIDGVVVDFLKADGEMVTVGDSQLSDFDNNVLGMQMGETREFSIVVPEGAMPSLVGKTVDFKVTLLMGSKITPCPLDDTLALKVGKRDFAELREFAMASAMAQLKNKEKSMLNGSLGARLVDENKFDVPNWMSLSEAQYLAHNAKLEWESISDEDKEKFILMGSRNVKLSLILDKIREVEPDAQLSDQEVLEIIKQNISKSKVKESMEDVMKEMTRTGYLQVLFSRIKDEYTLDFILKSATITE